MCGPPGITRPPPCLGKDSHSEDRQSPCSSPQQRRPRIYSSSIRQVPFSQRAENHSAEVNVRFPKPSPRRDAGAVITEDAAGWGGPSSRRAADAGRSTRQGLGWGPPASRPSESGWISSRGDGGFQGGRDKGQVCPPEAPGGGETRQPLCPGRCPQQLWTRHLLGEATLKPCDRRPPR